MRRLTIALPILSLLFAGAAQAAPLYDSLDSATADPDGEPIAAPAGPLADSFTTGAAFDLTEIDFKLGLASRTDGLPNSTGSVMVSLLPNNSDTPGSPALASGTILDSLIPMAGGTVSFSFAAAPGLAANTRYWIQLTAVDDSTAFWDFTDDITGAGVHDEFNANTSGVVANTDAGPYQMRIAGPAGPTNIPEPLTLSLFGAGLAGASAIRRRKAK